MQGIAKGLPTKGSGTVKWRTLMQDGTHHTVALSAFYVPSTSQQLLSPQHFLQHGTFSTPPFFKSFAENTQFVVGKKAKKIGYDKYNNLPMLHMMNASTHQREFFEPTFLDAVILMDKNVNLTSSQKKLLHWHYQLCHQSFDSLQ